MNLRKTLPGLILFVAFVVSAGPAVAQNVDDGKFTSANVMSVEAKEGRWSGGGGSWILVLEASCERGIMNLDFTLGSPEPSVWVTLLLMSTAVDLELVPLFVLPLPAVSPPVSISLSHSFPEVGMVAFLSVLLTEEGVQVGDVAVVDTGVTSEIMFDLSPGTSAPPPTLGGYPMTPVPYPGAPACTALMPPLPTPGAGGIDITPVSGQRCIGAGWAMWSHGYTGDVYYTGGETTQTITPPPGTSALYFYVEPNPIFDHIRSYPFEVVADGVSSGTFTAHGSAGASYVGVYDSCGGGISNVQVNSSVDFATGEYGWSD